MKPASTDLQIRQNATPAAHASPFASLRLETEQLAAEVYLPDATAGFYRGTRFDHAGQISRIICGEHTYLAPLKETHDPSNHDDVAGLAEEFGMFTPLGYEQAKPGETFVKIGVGVLVRPDEKPYQFSRPYEWSDMPRWRVIHDTDFVRFEQKLINTRGWSYRYVKTVTLGREQPTLTVHRSLTNLGTRDIDTDHYGHNFIVIDDQRVVGPELDLTWNFEPKIEELKGEPIVRCEGRKLSLTAPLVGEDSLWMLLSGYGDSGSYRVTVAHHGTGGEMTIAGDRRSGRLAVWSRSPSICPEFFVPLHVLPKQTLRWQTVYSFASSR